MKEKVIEFAQKMGYSTAEFHGMWKGYECYEPYKGSNDTLYTGLPHMILVRGDKVRLTNDKEAIEILDAGI